MKTDRSPWAIKGVIVWCCIIAGDTTIHAKRLNIKRTSQEKSNWCWAASTQMVLSHYDISKTQSEICQYVKSSLVNQGAQPDEIIKGIKWGGIPCSNKGALSEQQIKYDADKGRTFIFVWYWKGGGGQALVYDGYEGSQYFVHDPWQSNPTIAHSFSSLKSAGGKGGWCESMTCDKDKGGILELDPEPESGTNRVLE